MSGPEARLPPWRRLDVRLALWLCLGAAAILLLAGAASIALQREQMTRLLGLNAAATAETIVRSTRDSMLANDPDGLRRMLATIGSQPGFERVRVFDKLGRITASSDPADTGAFVDKQAEQCFACHSAGQPLQRLEGADRVRTFRGEDGEELLGVIAPIRNDAECSGCHVHPPDKVVLGVLDVQLSLEPVEAQLVAAEWRLGLGLAGAVGALLLLAGYLAWRLVLRPVRELHRATERVAAGDLGARARVSAPDELGLLAGTWNDTVAELARARDELQRWSHDLERRVEAKTAELEAAHRHMLVVEKMASLGKLAAVVAHELNNPLAGIATYARLLHRRLPPAEAEGESGRALALVEREAVRCGEIVRNLLVFSRAAGARFAPERLPVLFERVAMLVRHKADLQEVRIACEAPPDLPAVECDGSQVQQALLALAVNAIEAMPQGGTLTLRAEPAGAEVAVSVADTGVGIPAADLARIFEPFFSTKEEGKGVGLGLSVVYGIVERHHGRIDVRSTPGAGTTFTLRLPLRQPAPAGEPHAQPAREPAEAAP